MATQPQLVANRLNAQQSTGPKTAEGKQTSSRNAVRHGLYASIDSLCAAERAQFDDIFSHFAQQFPQPEAETHLLSLALAWFRRERVRRMEAAFFDLQLQHLAQMFPDDSHDQLLARAFMGDGLKYNAINKLHRWERAFSRDIDHALASLNQIAKTNPIPEPASGPTPELSPNKPTFAALPPRPQALRSVNSEVCWEESQPSSLSPASLPPEPIRK